MISRFRHGSGQATFCLRDMGMLPFPDLFPVGIVDHGIARADIMRAGDYLGSGEIYDAHRGTSNSEAGTAHIDARLTA